MKILVPSAECASHWRSCCWPNVPICFQVRPKLVDSCREESVISRSTATAVPSGRKSTSQSPPPLGLVIFECLKVLPPSAVYQNWTVEPSFLSSPGVQMMPCRPSGAQENDGSPYDGPVPIPTVVMPSGP